MIESSRGYSPAAGQLSLRDEAKASEISRKTREEVFSH
jgi:hypothetical protein